MGLELEITFCDENGDQCTESLPAKFEVCGLCQGHGTYLNRAIGEHAYSMEEFHEAFDHEERAEYFRRGGMYDVSCERCAGERVVKVVNEAACHTPELRALLERYWQLERDRAECEATERAERRMGA